MINELIDKYIALRDHKAKLEADHKATLAPINAGMAKIENYLLAQMNEQGVTSFKVNGIGTAYQAVQTSITLADWDSYRLFLDKQDDPFRYLDRKANKKAVEEWIGDHQDVPPGLNLRREVTVNIRRD